ncbi:MAG: hypothetical protein ACLGIV_07360, partial [Actinomycetes bacterium]
MAAVVMAAVAVMLLVAVVRPVEIDHPVGLPTLIAVIAVLYGLAEVSKIHVEVRGQALSISLSDMPLVLGLFLLPPEWLLLARLAPALLVHLARRTAAAKSAFNIGLFTLEVAVALSILDLLAPGRSPGATAWGATYLAVIVVDILGALAVIAAMRTLGSKPSRADISQMIAALVVSGVLSATLALMAVLVLDTSRAGLALLAALAVVVAVAHRAYYRLLRRHKDLNRLFAFTQSVGVSGDSDAVVSELLHQARELLNAETAVLRLRSESDETVPAVTDPVVIPRNTRDPSARAWLAQANVRDAVV